MGNKVNCSVIGVFVAAVLARGGAAAPGSGPMGNDMKTVQAQVVLTVSESKRLIAKGIARVPIVTAAMKNGMIIIAKGSTNTYVAEELTGRDIAPGAYLLGRRYPVKGGDRPKPAAGEKEVVLVKGKESEMSIDEAVKLLRPGDVVIKGANALNYSEKLAAVIVGSSDCGTTGKIMPYVTGRKAHLLIPVGLEKQTCGRVVETATMMREPVESLNDIPSMFLLNGIIFTEIEAIKTFADVSVFQAAAGGIGGAEGAVWLVVRGTKCEVQKVLDAVGKIQGEPPFVN
jgi:hypothetical protein